VPARTRLNQARVTCFPPNPSVVSASFESSIFASASEQKSKNSLSAATSLFFRVRVVHLNFGSWDGDGLTAQQMIRFDHVGVELFLLPLAAAFALILDLFWRCDVLGLAVTK
jgi:hypothetical protein